MGWGAFVRLEPHSGQTGRTMGLDKYPCFHVVLVMWPTSCKPAYSFNHEAITRSDHLGTHSTIFSTRSQTQMKLKTWEGSGKTREEVEKRGMLIRR